MHYGRAEQAEKPINATQSGPRRFSMKMFQRVYIMLALTAASFSVPALADKVVADYDHSANFGQYHTYCWGQVHSADPLFEQRIRDAVDHDLQTKGWQQGTDGSCDVTTTAVLVKRHQNEYTTFYDGLGGHWGWRGWGGGFGMATTSVDKIPVGTLVVDMYDTSSGKLVWRGQAYDQLSDKPEKDTKKLEKAVDKMFEKFPPPPE
jgi:hypothetical protein